MKSNKQPGGGQFFCMHNSGQIGTHFTAFSAASYTNKCYIKCVPVVILSKSSMFPTQTPILSRY